MPKGKSKRLRDALKAIRRALKKHHRNYTWSHNQECMGSMIWLVFRHTSRYTESIPEIKDFTLAVPWLTSCKTLEGNTQKDVDHVWSIFFRYASCTSTVC